MANRKLVYVFLFRVILKEVPNYDFEPVFPCVVTSRSVERASGSIGQFKEL
jgi:hypothetical protein